jgi:thymidylate kinase
MNFHIETIGIPGSGKSTYSELVNTMMNRRGVSYLLPEVVPIAAERSIPNGLKRRMHVWMGKVDFLHRWQTYLRPPGLSLDAFLTFMTDRPQLFRLLFENQIERDFLRWERAHDLKHLARLCAGYQLARDTFSSVESLVIDEGFAYIPVRTYRHGVAVIESNVREYLSLIPAPDLLIRIQCPPELCVERMKRRPSGYPGRMKEDDPVQRLAFLREFQALLDVVERELVDLGVPVVTVDSTSSLGEIEAQLTLDLRDVLGLEPGVAGDAAGTLPSPSPTDVGPVQHH